MLGVAEGEVEQKEDHDKEKTAEEIMVSITELTISNRGKIWPRKKTETSKKGTPQNRW